MSHLNLESLARLVDEEPTALDAAHLELCDSCRRELDELRADSAALTALPVVLPPPAGAWTALEARLASEGLLAGRRPRRAWAGALMQLAAALALLAIGTGLGAFVLAPHVSAADRVAMITPDDDARTHDAPATTAPGAQPAPGGRAGGAADSDAATRADTAPSERVGDDAPAITTPPRVTPRARQPAPEFAPTRPPVRQAAAETFSERPGEWPAPRTAEDALAWMRAAEAQYLQALTSYAELAGGIAGGDPMARLAALEGIVLTTRAALSEAPADPVINGYHMTALAQRETTLRQIATLATNSWF